MHDAAVASQLVCTMLPHRYRQQALWAGSLPCLLSTHNPGQRHDCFCLASVVYWLSLPTVHWISLPHPWCAVCMLRAWQVSLETDERQAVVHLLAAQPASEVHRWARAVVVCNSDFLN